MKRKKRNKKNKANPNKKSKKRSLNELLNINNNNKKIKRNDNNNLINQLQPRRNTKNILNKIIYPDNLSEEQIYNLYLNINKKSDSELNELDYNKAIKIDKRTFYKYYLSLVRTNHLFFYSFYPSFDYNSRIIKIYLFFFNFTATLMVNALFFDDNTMHKIYVDKGSFDFIYNLPQIIYTTIISGFMNGLISTLSTTSSNIINLKQSANKNNAMAKKDETIKIIKIKLSLFFIIDLIFLVIFWFYLACFCAVYKNTQMHLIKDTLISFATGMVSPFAIYIIPGLFRISALNAKKKDKEYMYKFSKALQIL